MWPSNFFQTSKPQFFFIGFFFLDNSKPQKLIFLKKISNGHFYTVALLFARQGKRYTTTPICQKTSLFEGLAGQNQLFGFCLSLIYSFPFLSFFLSLSLSLSLSFLNLIFILFNFHITHLQ